MKIFGNVYEESSGHSIDEKFIFFRYENVH